MPSYRFLLDRKLDLSLTPTKIKVMRQLGVPYPESMVKDCQDLARAQAKTISDDLAKDGVTGMEDKDVIALIAYLQRLGTDIKWREAAAQGTSVSEVTPAPTDNAVTAEPAKVASTVSKGAGQ